MSHVCLPGECVSVFPSYVAVVGFPQLCSNSVRSLTKSRKNARVFIAVPEVLATDKCVSTEECVHSWCWLLPFLEPPCWFSKALSSFPVEVMDGTMIFSYSFVGKKV